jgi:hypothetical protein
MRELEDTIDLTRRFAGVPLGCRPGRAARPFGGYP